MIQRFLNSYLRQFERPVPGFAIDYARWVICLAFIYKLLSRDFTLFADVPSFLMEVYPIDNHGLRYFHLMGIKPLVDIVTLHFIYWFIDMPGAFGMQILQWGTIGACAALAVFGRGPYRIFSIIAFAMVMHLWGFMMRSNHDLDDVEILQSLLLLYIFSSHKEGLTIFRPVIEREKTHAAGYMYAAFLMAFIIYYFPSGVNKLIDITLIDWFRYDYSGLLQLRLVHNTLGDYESIPGFFRYFPIVPAANFIGVPIVYFSHLLSPMILWRRAGVYFFILFYIIFHVLSWGVSIFFFGNVLALLAILPVYRFLRSENSAKALTEANMSHNADMLIVYDGECPFCSSYVSLLRLRETVGTVKLVNAREDQALVDKLQREGFDLNDGMAVLYQDKVYYGSDAIHILALLSSPSGAFNRINHSVFRHAALAKLTYPAMRAGRNLALLLLGRKKLSIAPRE